MRIITGNHPICPGLEILNGVVLNWNFDTQL